METYRKKDIRKKMINLRNQLTEQQVNELSEKIISKLIKLPVFKNSQTIMLYLSFNNEVDTFKLIEKCQALGKKVIVPYCVNQGKKIIPVEIRDVENDLVKSKFGYMEPKKEIIEAVDTETIDLIIIPGIAFDRNCYRIGFGAGYYDRFLGKLNFKISTIGLIYDFQLIELMPVEQHDIPVDYVITEKRIVVR